MGDFAARELWRVSYLDVTPESPCAGCGKPLKEDERAYARADIIWHAGCWPRTDAVATPRTHRVPQRSTEEDA